MGGRGDGARWQGLLEYLTETRFYTRAWAEILPLTTNDAINRELDSYNRRSYGRITSGCGGGYIILATEQEIPNAFSVRIRR